MTHAAEAISVAEIFDTRLFGTLTVRSRDILHAVHGLPGFPEARRFVLLDPPSAALHWLQCLDDLSLTFLLVDYTRIGNPLTSEGESPYAIVTLPGRDRPATVNRRAPVLVDFTRHTVRQLILMDSNPGITDPIDLDALVTRPRYS